ncbi:MAG TPA: tartrate dehydrogenase [Dehalococcoidia bacterium]|jgi:tartrate dehydrogenase/decarboxylase/D-malate dehydrogenase|nr:tartrate dehydrogenase [Chloroflexota bacterium]MDP5876562.1 tartrate dehydrogenase [Dehalococcoidia bacterium]MDP6272510.1 tartrate dehydrogenase [Dehalococcoidia bacterium]MDP7161281.1 tartrate dehydrogenase [Dehalococcoidia bacterium]MDP7213145.1 tartrate dehydrogenase [Dehalococcoidia bacterium]|tara:strand:+ start:348 stop:1412 length:1065 start_codon:yes stop_codon:yes gene_type:complete
MSKRKIAVIRGDGIGVEVVGEALKVLEAAGAKHGIEWTFDEFPWSSQYYREHGQMMPDDGVDQLRDYDAIFLGAVGQPDIQDHITLNGLLLPIRRTFDQFVCERPSILFPGVTSPLSGKKPYDVDMLVIRENTEGEYSGMGGFMYEGQPDEVAVQTAAFTRRGCERIIRYAFEAASKRNKQKHVTSITKSNALGYSMVLWDRTFEEVSGDYPDISTNSLLIDAACMDFIRKPESFDVVVASNLFGDILTDIGAVITGSMGLASSANFDPTRENPSMFEPTHGSAPDIAGQGLANPMAQILTGAMMVRHLGDEAAADAIEASVKSVLEVGELLTPDLGGSASTSGVGDAIAGNLA